jgi:pimeloyl-ACP methyl ester carboxylesterase
MNAYTWPMAKRATEPGARSTYHLEMEGGTIEYIDTGGDGPVLVFLHGLLMDASLWDGVIADLAPRYRCVAPTLPLGAHAQPMQPGADLSLPGIARLVGELLDRLELDKVILVGNDTGGALVQLLMYQGCSRVGGIVLVSCDAFDNFPPGLTGKVLVATGKLPPSLFGLFMQHMRLRFVRRLPTAFGWLTKPGDTATARWSRPVLQSAEIRTDTIRVLRAIAADRHLLLKTAERLKSYDKPALIVWAKEDRVMPLEHGRRLAQLLPQGHLVEIPDSLTLVPLDQPALLACAIRDFTSWLNFQADQDPTHRALDMPVQSGPTSSNRS